MHRASNTNRAAGGDASLNQPAKVKDSSNAHTPECERMRNKHITHNVKRLKPCDNFQRGRVAKALFILYITLFYSNTNISDRLIPLIEPAPAIMPRQNLAGTSGVWGGCDSLSTHH